MKKTSNLMAAIVAFTTLAGNLKAASITVGDPTEGGIGYSWVVEMSGSDSAVLSNHVGAWSWNNGATNPPVGWTHTSNWINLTLTAPSTLTLVMDRKEGVPWAGGPEGVATTESMFPSFTLWSGLDNTSEISHTYNSVGNIAWSAQLTYVDSYNNTTLATIERSWQLAAGSYTLVLGSSAPTGISGRQGYEATLTTSAVPEPATIAALMGGLGFLALAKLRRLRKVAA